MLHYSSRFLRYGRMKFVSKISNPLLPICFAPSPASFPWRLYSSSTVRSLFLNTLLLDEFPTEFWRGQHFTTFLSFYFPWRRLCGDGFLPNQQWTLNKFPSELWRERSMPILLASADRVYDLLPKWTWRCTQQKDNNNDSSQRVSTERTICCQTCKIHTHCA